MPSHHRIRRVRRSRSSPAFVSSSSSSLGLELTTSNAHQGRPDPAQRNPLRSWWAQQRQSDDTSSTKHETHSSQPFREALKSHVSNFLSYVTPPLFAAPQEGAAEEEEQQEQEPQSSPSGEEEMEAHTGKEYDREVSEEFSSSWLPPSPSINARHAFVDLHKEQLEHIQQGHDKPEPVGVSSSFVSQKSEFSTERETSLPRLHTNGTDSELDGRPRRASTGSGPFAGEASKQQQQTAFNSYGIDPSTLHKFDSHLRSVQRKSKSQKDRYRKRVSRKVQQHSRRCTICRVCYCLRKTCKGLWTFLAAATVIVGIFSLVVPLIMEVLDPEDVLVDQLFSSGWLSDISQDNVAWQHTSQTPFSTGDAYTRPGLRMAREGLKKYHPVVFLPGLSSTGLEIWQGKACMKNNFRERIWGESLTLRKLVLNELCWLEHMMLNETTGLDPNDIKVRAASGIRAADYIMGYYSLWGTVVKNLADLGYDENSIHMASYDWRLGPHHQEIRDRAWTRLKNAIEQLYSLNDQTKVVVIAHSLGTNYFLYFLQWAERQHMIDQTRHGVPLERIGVDTWTDKYVSTVLNIAGPLLGVPKGIPSLYSGEMRDTAELGPMALAVKERIFPKRHVKALFRSYGSVAALLPLGGDKVWGGAIPDTSDDAIQDIQRDKDRHVSHSEAAALQQEDDEAYCIAKSSRFIMKNFSSKHVAPDQVNNHGVYGHMMVLHHRIYDSVLEEDGSQIFGSSRQRARMSANMASKAAEAVLNGLKWSYGRNDDSSDSDSQDAVENTTTTIALEPSGMDATEALETDGKRHSFADGDVYGRASASNAPQQPSTVVSETSTGIIEYVVPDSTVDTLSMHKDCTYKGSCTNNAETPGCGIYGNATDPLENEGQSPNGEETFEYGCGATLTRPATATHRDKKFILGPRISRTYLSLEDVYNLMREQDSEFMQSLDSFVNLTATRPPPLSELLPNRKTFDHLNFANGSYTLEGLSSPFIPEGYTADEIVAGMAPHQYWTNPLSVPLPNAPNMSIISLYGVGSVAERAYHFESVLAPANISQNTLDDDAKAGELVRCLQTNSACGYKGHKWRHMPVRLATDVNHEEAQVANGVQRTEGDVTVPILSLGFMPTRGWNTKLRNPSNITLVSREFTQDFKRSDEDIDIATAPPSEDDIPDKKKSTEQLQKDAQKISNNIATAMKQSIKLENQKDVSSPLGDQKTLFTALKDAADSIKSAGIFRACLDWMRSNSNDHIDILLNAGALEDVLRVAAGKREMLQHRKLSHIDEISRGVILDED